MNTKFFFKFFVLLIVVAMLFGMTTSPASAYNGDCKGKSCDPLPGNGKACDPDKLGNSGKNNPHCQESEPPAPTPVPAGTAMQTKNNITTGGVGNLVWADFNEDGTQDLFEYEVGVAGVEVRLYSGSGEYRSLLAITTTDEDGKYFFPIHTSGYYSLQFVIPTQLETMTFTTPNVGTDDDIDSDVEEGYTSAIYLSAEAVNNTVDCGLVSK